MPLMAMSLMPSIGSLIDKSMIKGQRPGGTRQNGKRQPTDLAARVPKGTGAQPVEPSNVIWVQVQTKVCVPKLNPHVGPVQSNGMCLLDQFSPVQLKPNPFGL